MNEIEKKFFNAFSEYLNNKNLFINNKFYELLECESSYQLSAKDDDTLILFEIEIQPNAECFSGYIPDFAIYINGVESGYVIEIDGHEWHEKTKEQAKADKEKDRIYLKHGFIPVRFTGSEVYHNVNNCIRELFEIIEFNSQFFEYDAINGLYENEKKTSEYLSQENEELSEKVYQLCYGRVAKKAIFISSGNIELTPNITETA